MAYTRQCRASLSAAQLAERHSVNDLSMVVENASVGEGSGWRGRNNPGGAMSDSAPLRPSEISWEVNMSR